MDKIRETSCGERIDRHPKWLTGLSASGMLRFQFLALPVYNMFLVHTVRRVFSKLDVYGKIAQITYTHIQLYNHYQSLHADISSFIGDRQHVNIVDIIHSHSDTF